jgi:hypothetical protein
VCVCVCVCVRVCVCACVCVQTAYRRHSEHCRMLELDELLRATPQHGEEGLLLLLVKILVVHESLLVKLPHRHCLACSAIRRVVDLREREKASGLNRVACEQTML